MKADEDGESYDEIVLYISKNIETIFGYIFENILEFLLRTFF